MCNHVNKLPFSFLASIICSEIYNFSLVISAQVVRACGPWLENKCAIPFVVWFWWRRTTMSLIMLHHICSAPVCWFNNLSPPVLISSSKYWWSPSTCMQIRHYPILRTMKLKPQNIPWPLVSIQLPHSSRYQITVSIFYIHHLIFILSHTLISFVVFFFYLT